MEQILGKWFAISLKIKYNPAILQPRYLLQRNDSMCSYKHLYMDVHGSFVCSIPKLETTHMVGGR